MQTMVQVLPKIVAKKWLPILAVVCVIVVVHAAENGTESGDSFQFNNTTNTTAVALTPDQYFGGSDQETYVSWYQSLDVAYTGSVYLPPSNSNSTYAAGNGVAVHWRVDESYLYVGVAARAQDGWLALGIAEAGGMKGADIVIYESSNPNTLTDFYVLDQLVHPLVDDCQDWILNNVTNSNGFLIFEGQRLLDTADAQDHAVINDSETSVPAERIIAAWGDSDTVEYHGLINRARGTIRWFGVGDEYVKFHKQVDAEADGYFDLRVNNFSIAAIETNYVDFCFNWDIDIVPQGLPSNRNVAIMAAEILIDKESAPFVHHAAVSASPNTGNASRTCLASKEYTQFLYSWTPGTLPFLLPPDIGITLGSGELQGLQSFRLQIHYNNPKFIESMRDNGGLRVYYTLARPLYEAGLLPLGDLLTSLEGTPINVGTSRFDFSCDGACSSLVLDNEPVTVIHEFFHMHNRGAAAVQYQIRDGAVVRQANVNFFDFDQAGVFAVRQQPYQILPGDSFSTTCFFSSNDNATFGESSSNEMCNSVILYYPAKRIFNAAPWICLYDTPLAACNATLSTSMVVTTSSELTTSSLTSTENALFTSGRYLDRTFGYSSVDECFANSPMSEGNTTSGATATLFLWSSLCFIAPTLTMLMFY